MFYRGKLHATSNTPFNHVAVNRPVAFSAATGTAQSPNIFVTLKGALRAACPCPPPPRRPPVYFLSLGSCRSGRFKDAVSHAASFSAPHPAWWRLSAFAPSHDRVAGGAGRARPASAWGHGAPRGFLRRLLISLGPCVPRRGLAGWDSDAGSHEPACVRAPPFGSRRAGFTCVPANAPVVEARAGRPWLGPRTCASPLQLVGTEGSSLGATGPASHRRSVTLRDRGHGGSAGGLSQEGRIPQPASPRGLRATLFGSIEDTHQLRERGAQVPAWSHSSRATPGVPRREARQRPVDPPPGRVAPGPAPHSHGPCCPGRLLFSSRRCDFGSPL